MLTFLLLLPLVIVALVLQARELIPLLNLFDTLATPMGLVVASLVGMLLLSLAAVGWALFDHWRNTQRHEAARTLP